MFGRELVSRPEVVAEPFDSADNRGLGVPFTMRAVPVNGTEPVVTEAGKVAQR